MKTAARPPGRTASKTSTPGTGAGAVPRGGYTVARSWAVRDTAAAIDSDARVVGAEPLPAGGGDARR
jgi:hypothetical protein